MMIMKKKRAIGDSSLLTHADDIMKVGEWRCLKTDLPKNLWLGISHYPPIDYGLSKNFFRLIIMTMSFTQTIISLSGT